MKTVKIIFDTVHFMFTLALIIAVLILWLKLEHAEDLISALTVLYSNIRNTVGGVIR